jgi:hypothetical protein
MMGWLEWNYDSYNYDYVQTTWKIGLYFNLTERNRLLFSMLLLAVWFWLAFSICDLFSNIILIEL